MRWLLLTIAAILGFAAGSAWPTLRSTLAAKKGESKPTSATAPASAPPLRVATVTVEPTALAEVVSATGSLRAAESVELQAEISGKIVAINFDEGSHVRKGDLLVKLNDADLRGTLQRAAWRRELAELKERRLAQLLQSASVKQEDYDAALNELNVQRAEVAITEALIAKTEIRAPFDGVVGLRFVSEGAFVNATTRIATLQNLDGVKVDFAVPEKYASRIHLGNRVTFTVPGGSGKLEGKIYAIDPKIDSATRTVVLRALYSGSEAHLLPGGFANIEFTLAEIPNAILVPNIAVVPGASGNAVFVVADGKAARRAVTTGARNESTIHIIDGLKAGDVVITSGLQQIRAGQAVAADEKRSGQSKKKGRPSEAQPSSVHAATD